MKHPILAAAIDRLGAEPPGGFPGAMLGLSNRCN
jgi:hypothetical protein